MLSTTYSGEPIEEASFVAEHLRLENLDVGNGGIDYIHILGSGEWKMEEWLKPQPATSHCPLTTPWIG